MGEMADMLLAQAFDDWESDEWVRSSLGKSCRHCNKTNLAWREVKKQWVLFEKNGNMHHCHGYEPSLEVLKVIAQQSLEETRKDAIWRLYEKTKKRGNVRRMINLLSDEDLIDLYACFVRDAQRDYDAPDVEKSFMSYKNELKILRGELLHRMAKQ
jgi:hypothetical protein